MQNTHPSKDTQPQHVSDAGDTPSPATGASDKQSEQITDGADSVTSDSAKDASAPALDVVLEASLESFPASDPPAWTYGSP